MKTPFFTIGIPTFNRGRMLEASISSVLRQTFEDFELLIADNHSEDKTEQIVASFVNDRIRYVRHKENYGYFYNFTYLAKNARGTFFVLLQDDDLLSENFLERAYKCLSNNDSLVMYATPWWRGSSKTGFSSTLLRSPLITEEILNKAQPIIFNGHDMAVKLLYLFPFIHPCIAMRTETFEAIGWYDDTPGADFIFDLLTEAKLLCRGDVCYDPSIGAIFRTHEESFTRTTSRALKRANYGLRYQRVVQILENNDVDWQPLLSQQISDMPFDDTLKLFRQLLRRRAPVSVLKICWKNIKDNKPSDRLTLYRTLQRKVGFLNLLQFVIALLSQLSPPKRANT